MSAPVGSVSRWRKRRPDVQPREDRAVPPASESRPSGEQALREVRVGLTAGMVVANVFGAAAVFVLGYYAVPGLQTKRGASVLTNVIIAVAYIAVAAPIGTLI